MNTSATETITTNLSTVMDSFDGAASAVVDATADLVDVAGSASVVGGRILTRTVRRSGRYVQRHPTGMVGFSVVLVALLTVYMWRRRSESATSDAAERKVAS